MKSIHLFLEDEYFSLSEFIDYVKFVCNDIPDEIENCKGFEEVIDFARDTQPKFLIEENAYEITLSEEKH